MEGRVSGEDTGPLEMGWDSLGSLGSVNERELLGRLETGLLETWKGICQRGREKEAEGYRAPETWGGLLGWSPCRGVGSRASGSLEKVRRVPRAPGSSEGLSPHSPALDRSPGTRSSSSSGSITGRVRGSGHIRSWQVWDDLAGPCSH